MIEKYINKIINGDCISKLKELPENSVDLIFADPPYNLQLQKGLYRPNDTKVNGVDDDWDSFISFEEYDNFTKDWLTECKRVLKEDGTLWVIGSYHNIFRVGKILQDLGFWILNDILWIKTNPMPNFKGTRFNNSHETLIWAAKNSKSRYTFHYKSMKIFNDEKQMRSDWYIPICNGGERIYKNGQKAHSTQKPEALLYRIIISTTNPGDIILDPFMGSGTTAAVAKKLQRKYIGIEREAKYIEIAEERLQRIEPITDSLLSYSIENARPKVAFGNLIETGYLVVGEKLYSKDRKYYAKILANGSISWFGEVGSIHSISAKILKKTNNNGWGYWFIERNGMLKSIDDLRTNYFKEQVDV